MVVSGFSVICSFTFASEILIAFDDWSSFPDRILAIGLSVFYRLLLSGVVSLVQQFRAWQSRSLAVVLVLDQRTLILVS